MALMFPPNNPAIRARIRRGTTIIAGPVKCNVQSSTRMQYPEFFPNYSNSNATGEDSFTHTIYTSTIGTYKPFIGDVLIISGSTDGLLDGEYVVKLYSSNQVGMNQKLNHVKFIVRFLGAKKPGDTGSNNKTNVRFGGD